MERNEEDISMYDILRDLSRKGVDNGPVGGK